jgi:hypothetical protein
MVKKNGSGKAPARIDVRFALKEAKPLWNSKGSVRATGKIAIFAVAVILLALILLAVAVFIYIRSKS